MNGQRGNVASWTSGTVDTNDVRPLLFRLTATHDNGSAKQEVVALKKSIATVAPFALSNRSLRLQYSMRMSS